MSAANSAELNRTIGVAANQPAVGLTRFVRPTMSVSESDMMLSSIGYDGEMSSAALSFSDVKQNNTRPIDFRSLAPPCRHNNWDNARVKTGRMTLRCRDCDTKWKVQQTKLALCDDFHANNGVCALGASCPLLHVHRFKDVERCPNPPNYALGTERDDRVYAAAAKLLSELPRGTPASQIAAQALGCATQHTAPVRVATPPSSVTSSATWSPSTDLSLSVEEVTCSCACPRVGGLKPISERYVPIQRRMMEQEASLAGSISPMHAV